MQQLLSKFLKKVLKQGAKNNLRLWHFILPNRIVAAFRFATQRNAVFFDEYRCRAQVSDTTGADTNFKSLLTKNFLLLLLLIVSQFSFAQKANNVIKSGNDAYKKGDYKNAEKFYKEALEGDENNLVASFNLGNALLKQNNIVEAEKYFSKVAKAADESDFKAKAYYNKGLTMIKYQKLPEAIDAFKQSLILNPDDNDTRENLQKAIDELKKQQNQQPQQKPQPQKKQEPQKQQNKTASKDVMEQKFEELRDKEKQLQKLLQKKSNDNQPDKDW